MIKLKDEHLFFWKTKDYEPLRAVVAVGLSLLLFTLLMQAVLPKLEIPLHHNKPKHSASAPRIATLTELDIRSRGVAQDDPFLTGNHIRKQATKVAEATLHDLLAQQARIPYKVQYQEVQYDLPSTNLKPLIRPLLVERDPMKLRPTRAISPKPRRVVLSTSPGLPKLPPAPFSTLGRHFSRVSFHLTISPSGRVEHLLCLPADYNNRNVISWIRALQFPPSSSSHNAVITAQLAP